MDVWGITLATLRRWYVCLPVLVAAGLLALAAGQSASPEYEATGTAMYTPPRLTPDRESPTIANPFSNEEGANSAITVVLNGPSTREAIAELGLDGTVTVSQTARSPIFTVRAVSSDQATALAIVDEVIDIASDELTARQTEAGIVAQYSIGLHVLAAPSITDIDNNTAIRVQAVILALGAAAAVTLAVLFDDIVGLIRRRRQRRRSSAASPRRHPEANGQGEDPKPAEGEVAVASEGEAVIAEEPVEDAQPQRTARRRRRKRGRLPRTESVVSNASDQDVLDSGGDSAEPLLAQGELAHELSVAPPGSRR